MLFAITCNNQFVPVKVYFRNTFALDPDISSPETGGDRFAGAGITLWGGWCLGETDESVTVQSIEGSMFQRVNVPNFLVLKVQYSKGSMF